MKFELWVILVLVYLSLYVTGSFIFNMDHCKIYSQLLWNVMKFCFKNYYSDMVTFSPGQLHFVWIELFEFV